MSVAKMKLLQAFFQKQDSVNVRSSATIKTGYENTRLLMRKESKENEVNAIMCLCNSTLYISMTFFRPRGHLFSGASFHFATT
jgi:chromosome condensin MukBEF complex kleisin-like MukF subunit